MTGYFSAETQLLDRAEYVRNLLVNRATLQEMHTFYVTWDMRTDAENLCRELATVEERLSAARQSLTRAVMAYVHTLSPVLPNKFAEGLLNPLMFCEGEGEGAPERYQEGWRAGAQWAREVDREEPFRGE